jgi:hypothetical protein
MKPSFFSTRGFQQNKIGWFQAGQNVTYEESVHRREINE